MRASIYMRASFLNSGHRKEADGPRAEPRLKQLSQTLFAVCLKVRCYRSMTKLPARNRIDSPKIVLTADETMMSRYRGGSLWVHNLHAQGILPDWFFFSRVGATGATNEFASALFGLRSSDYRSKPGEGIR